MSRLGDPPRAGRWPLTLRACGRLSGPRTRLLLHGALGCSTCSHHLPTPGRGRGGRGKPLLSRSTFPQLQASLPAPGGRACACAGSPCPRGAVRSPAWRRLAAPHCLGGRGRQHQGQQPAPRTLNFKPLSAARFRKGEGAGRAVSSPRGPTPVAGPAACSSRAWPAPRTLKRPLV